MRLIIIGGDERSLMLKTLAITHGHETALIGHGENDLPPLGLYDTAVLPFPAVEQEGRVPAPLGCASLSAEEALAHCAPGARVFAAKAGPALEAAIRRQGCTRIDPMLDEAFLQENAVITAECAIGAAMSRSQACLWGAACLIVGYGRIGRALALRLRGLGARVTVAARRAASRMLAAGDGMDTAPLCGPFHEPFRFLFNTVPAPAVGETLLSALIPGALALDLASPPFGVDLVAAQRLGVQAYRESGLPGRCAPESAARAILHMIENCIDQTDGA